MAKKHSISIRNFVCPAVKCGAQLTIETDVPDTKKPRCFVCSRIMKEVESFPEDNKKEAIRTVEEPVSKTGARKKRVGGSSPSASGIKKRKKIKK